MDGGLAPDDVESLTTVRELESVFPLLHALAGRSLRDFLVCAAVLEALVATEPSSFSADALREVLYWLDERARTSVVAALRRSGWLEFEPGEDTALTNAGRWAHDVLGFLHKRLRESELLPTVGAWGASNTRSRSGWIRYATSSRCARGSSRCARRSTRVAPSEDAARRGAPIRVWADLDLDGVRIARWVDAGSAGTAHFHGMTPGDLPTPPAARSRSRSGPVRPSAPTSSATRTPPSPTFCGLSSTRGIGSSRRRSWADPGLEPPTLGFREDWVAAAWLVSGASWAAAGVAGSRQRAGNSRDAQREASLARDGLSHARRAPGAPRSGWARPSPHGAARRRLQGIQSIRGPSRRVVDRRTTGFRPPSAGFPWSLEQGRTARRSGNFPLGTGKPTRLLRGESTQGDARLSGLSARPRQNQSSTRRPLTRSKCSRLCVTRISPRESAWAAIIVSSTPIGTPSSKSTAARRP